MSKKFTWEVEKTSLILRVTDGAKETTWKIRKGMLSGQLITVFNEVLNSLWESEPAPWDGKPMLEAVRTVDAEELAELQRYRPVQADSEEASRAAQARRVAQLNVGAKWFEDLDDETYGVPIPDYDTGEIN